MTYQKGKQPSNSAKPMLQKIVAINDVEPVIVSDNHSKPSEERILYSSFTFHVS